MKKLYTLLSIFSMISFFQVSAFAGADKDCLRMMKQAKKTCKKQHRCVYEALNAAGFAIVNTGTEVFCKGDPQKGMVKSGEKGNEASPIQVKDRSRKSNDDRPIIKRKSGIKFD